MLVPAAAAARSGPDGGSVLWDSVKPPLSLHLASLDKILNTAVIPGTASCHTLSILKKMVVFPS